MHFFDILKGMIRGYGDRRRFGTMKYNKLIIPKSHFIADKPVWLLKPSDQNRGQGIKLFSSLP